LRVVLDTNVIISGLLWGKTTKILFDLADTRQITICLTPKIIEEISRVLNYPKIRKQLDSINLTIDEIINYLLQTSELYSDISIDINLSDVSDRIFVAAAIVSGVSYIVTGDKHLLALKKFQDIKIVTPNQFLKEI